MTETTPLTIADRYLAVWNEPDPGARRAAIASLWAPDGVEFVDGGTQHRGHQELGTRVTHAYQEFVAGRGYAVTAGGGVTRHDDIIMLTLRLTTGGGETAWAARTFLLLDGDGLIREDYQLTVKPLVA